VFVKRNLPKHVPVGFIIKLQCSGLNRTSPADQSLCLRCYCCCCCCPQQMLDLYHAGWYSMAYWADMADLAMQAASSAAESPAAAKALAESLMKERHSIFFARQVVTWLGCVHADTSGKCVTIAFHEFQAVNTITRYAVRCCFAEHSTTSSLLILSCTCTAVGSMLSASSACRVKSGS
jgi:hypothetical protein